MALKEERSLSFPALITLLANVGWLTRNEGQVTQAGPLKQMHEGDWIIYYSPTIRFQEKEPCRAFTAMGRI